MHWRPHSHDMPQLRRKCPKVCLSPPAIHILQKLIKPFHRSAVCSSCDGRGFNIFICTHCNPAVVAAAARSSASTTASSASDTANNTPGSSAPSSPGSLSRSPSVSYASSSHADPSSRASRSWKRYGDGRDGTSCGQVEMNTRNL
ncbi:hypothetical protein N7495_008581 [Penicillium taxi]|uniref:uncharacterized protein n=1 Tax=Penicillium taxi TaxID=168475 RepID=UPI0025452D44|nr:uncharacterized protein N7495_008581 [Penicillium taxi]KAJ5888540.1 hypothetical protein N7495_008581 [Penicillium taxi]